MSSQDDREFGHFRIPLTLNKGNVDVKEAERLIAKTNRYLKRFTESRPEHYANWNILGVLSFRIGQFEEALKYLDTVLSPNEDPDNLNALANRRYICEKLYRIKEARECEQKMTRLLQDDTVEGKKRLKKLKARSIAEQAFAFYNEIFEETTTNKKSKRSHDLYQQAIELAGEDVAPSEREDWIIQSGMINYKICTSIKWDKSKIDDKKSTYKKAVDNFIKIVEESKDDYRKSIAWRHLGQLFGEPNLTDAVFLPQKFQKYVSQPDECFKKALVHSPDDADVLATRAKYISNKTTALSLIERALEVDKSKLNLKPRTVRANIYLKQYKQQLKDFKKQPRRPNETLLTRAEEDLSFAIQDVSRPWYQESMAEVLYYMATDFNEKLKDEQKLYQALTYCAKAEEIADGWKRAGVHNLRGKCLCVIGEHEAALRSYKRALECEIATNSNYGRSAAALVVEYEHILPRDSDKLEEDLLRDMVYWLEKATRFCLSSGNWALWELNKLKQRHNHWRTFVKYCTDNCCGSQLELINSAERGDRSGFQHLRSSSHDQGAPTLREPEPTGNVRSAVGVSDVACLKPDTSPGDQYQRQPHAERQLSPHEVPVPVNKEPLPPADVQPTSAAQTEQPGEVHEDRNGLEQSLAALKLDDNAAASDIVQVTYTYNTKTGTIEQKSVASIESSVENAPGKFNKPAPEKSFHQEYDYDFFVIYTSSVSEWVERSMLKELEDTGNLKGCVQDRDFVLGGRTLMSYSECIKKSACTIVVVTKDLENDNICLYAMLQAVHHGGLLIPVLKEERDLPLLLKQYTPLKATDAVNWLRLESSIEQQMKPQDTKENR